MQKHPTRLSSHFHKFILHLLLGLIFASVAFAPQAPSAVLAAATNANDTPVRLMIPRLKLDAPIESVGKDAQGEASVPQKAQDVAWYNLGPVPGAPGNAVISGHLDDKVGPAIFWRLGELKVNDTLTVVDKAGGQRLFKVIEVATYPYTKAPINKIFGFDLEHDLNLITCTGRWNNKTHTYSQRLVVYTRLVTPGK